MDPHYFTPQEMDDDDDGHYFVGMGFVSKTQEQEFLLVENTVSLDDFFAHSGRETLRYLLETATSPPNWKRVEILRVHMTGWNRTPWLYYTCVFKTHYLRLVQRSWKKVFRERRRILHSSKMLHDLRNRERTGKFSLVLPNLRGMLAPYSKT